MTELFSLDARSEISPPTVESLFSLSILSAEAAIYNYADETGITSGGGNPEYTTRFVFLVNAEVGVSSTQFHPFAGYAFYLDCEPVERPAVPRHFQLVYDRPSDGPYFQAWASKVISYLSGCFHAPTIPPFDGHDVADVLLSVICPRLYFKLIPMTSYSRLNVALASIPTCKNLLSVLFAPPGWICLDELSLWEDANVVPGGRHTSGGAIHPYSQRMLMILGEPATDR